MSDKIIENAELLAPAGNFAAANAAIDAGADAVYLGYSTFSARASAENFSFEQLEMLLKRAHFFGVKVYVAMNTLVKDEETEEFIKTLLSVWNLGTDAIIMQDILLGKYIHDNYPDIVLHLSTQGGVNNVNGALLAKAYGFSRVILARETPFSEVEKIVKVLETEVFIQGALCSCFSGQCYFSSFVGGNSGNRGRCKQPCRKKYSFDRDGYREEAYALSLSDLCVGENIKKYLAAGVKSFKIEGRMRREEYVAAAVSYYRAILDGKGDKEILGCLSDLRRTFNRGNYTQGLSFGQDKRFLSRRVQGHMGEKVGVIKKVNGKLYVESGYQACEGDGFKILRGGEEVGGAVFAGKEKRGFYLSSKDRIANGDGVFVTTDTALKGRLLSKKRLLPVPVSLEFCVGKTAKITVGEELFTVESDEALTEAKSAPLTESEIRACFEKGGEIQPIFRPIMLENVFMPKSLLNAFRRKAYAYLFECRTKNANTRYEWIPLESLSFSGENERRAIIGDEDGEADIYICKPKDYSRSVASKKGSENYLYYPAFATEADENRIAELIKEGGFDGIYAENYSGIRFAETHEVKLFAGTGMNLTNRIAVNELLKTGAAYYAVSKELSFEEAKPLKSEKAFLLTKGGIKLMDLIYCPFEKTCSDCDKKDVYLMTDENKRQFPVRRYRGGEGECRFEVYNLARLSAGQTLGFGCLEDGTPLGGYARANTLGHSKNGMI